MINFNYELDFQLNNESGYQDWLSSFIIDKDYLVGDIEFIFCDDNYLIDINKQYLNHDTFTDIITFDYSIGRLISGDLFISIDRIIDNAKTYNTSFDDELLRVMSHGVFHLMGYKDKELADIIVIRDLENKAIELFHVKQSH
jgi:rRNA maturation RNase YbeY